MYNHGISVFLQVKKLKEKECINAFLKSENITDFTAKNHNRANKYIENNWVKFASFVDKGIKNGTLQGVAVKMNTHFDEQRDYREAVKREFNNAQLTNEQQELLDEIKQNGIGKLHSALMKKGLGPVSKNYEYKSKALQWLPVVNQIIENGIII